MDHYFYYFFGKLVTHLRNNVYKALYDRELGMFSIYLFHFIWPVTLPEQRQAHILFLGHFHNLEVTINMDNINNPVQPGKIKSGNLWVLDDFNPELILNDILRLNLNTVNVPIRVDIPSRTSLTMTINEAQKQKAVELIEVLTGKGIQVMLEPFPFIQGGQFGETEWNPADKKRWFMLWQTTVLNPLINTIAIPYQVWGLNIASNLVNFESMEAEWDAMIEETRRQFGGNVVFRTNWWYTASWSPQTQQAFTTKINRSYWKLVDFISIDAWFELNNQAVPSVEQIKSSMTSTEVYNRKQNVLQEIQRFHEVTGKDIYFGGFNIPALEYGLKFPWNEAVSPVKSPAVQANGWTAYKEMLEDLSYFLGFSVWVIGNNDPEYSYRVEPETALVIHDWYYDDTCSEKELEELRKELETLQGEMNHLQEQIEELELERGQWLVREGELINRIEDQQQILNEIKRLIDNGA
ncbi:hypothetical protein [Halobacillus sp. Cin3]|uniref:glycoside hydrolase family 113 n=1 Tax=Halobacillus sp. Cin3 TaxID=2928441 RepID=UPI00248D6ADF|nr:hypothetical protein [Halobacillus sp. Cin3]